MPKFEVTATFALETQLEPEISRRHWDEGDSVEFSDNSSFETESFQCSGGELIFTLEADDEDEAEDEARRAIIDDGHEVEDGLGITWSVTDLDISIEKQEMLIDEAVTVVREFLASREDAFREHHPVVFEALQVLVDYPF